MEGQEKNTAQLARIRATVEQKWGLREENKKESKEESEDDEEGSEDSTGESQEEVEEEISLSTSC